MPETAPKDSHKKKRKKREVEVEEEVVVEDVYVEVVGDAASPSPSCSRGRSSPVADAHPLPRSEASSIPSARAASREPSTGSSVSPTASRLDQAIAGLFGSPKEGGLVLPNTVFGVAGPTGGGAGDGVRRGLASPEPSRAARMANPDAMAGVKKPTRVQSAFLPRYSDDQDAAVDGHAEKIDALITLRNDVEEIRKQIDQEEHPNFNLQGLGGKSWDEMVMMHCKLVLQIEDLEAQVKAKKS